MLSACLAMCGCGKINSIVRHGISSESRFALTSVRARFTDGSQVDYLDNFTALEYADLRGSTCYEDIYAWSQVHPDVKVVYDVPLGIRGKVAYISSDIESLSLDNAEYIYSLVAQSRYLSGLKTIIITDSSITSAQLSSLSVEYKDAVIYYSIEGWPLISPYSAALDLSGITADELDSVAGFLRSMAHTTYVKLSDSTGNESISLEDVAALQEEFPDICFDYSFELFGQTVSTADERLEYELADIGNAGVETLRQVLPHLKQLKYLRLEQCGIDSAVLEELNNEFPDVDIVWRIFFSAYSCLTDETKIFASGSIEDEDTAELKYCHRIKYIDIGHTSITNIDFVQYMPDLEVGIFACGMLRDISAIANCPKLEYLEIFSSLVTDISALASCKNLAHLNISYLLGLRDISVLYDLTKLERVWCGLNYQIPNSQLNELAQRLPNCEICSTNKDPTGSHWRYDDNGNRVPRYELLAQQFGYDDLDYSWW